MPPSRYLFSVLISLVLLLPACSIQRLVPVEGDGKTKILTPVMPGVEKMTFKASINHRGNEYSGVLVVKKMPENEYRLAFFSEVGMSYLEGSLKGDAYPWKLSCNLVSPFLSSKNVLKNLETALNLLLVPGDQNSTRIEPGNVHCEDEYPAKIFFYYREKTIFLTLEKI